MPTFFGGEVARNVLVGRKLRKYVLYATGFFLGTVKQARVPLIGAINPAIVPISEAIFGAMRETMKATRTMKPNPIHG